MLSLKNSVRNWMTERKVLENCRSSVDQQMVCVGDLLLVLPQQMGKASHGYRDPRFAQTPILLFSLFCDRIFS